MPFADLFFGNAVASEVDVSTITINCPNAVGGIGGISFEPSVFIWTGKEHIVLERGTRVEIAFFELTRVRMSSDDTDFSEHVEWVFTAESEENIMNIGYNKYWASVAEKLRRIFKRQTVTQDDICPKPFLETLKDA